MTLDEQNRIAGRFFALGLDILNRKGKDYTPDDESLAEVRQIASEAGINPWQVLWIYMRKHLSAIERYVKVGSVESEPIEGRLLDLANYAALMYVLHCQDTEKCPDSEEPSQ